MIRNNNIAITNIQDGNIKNKDEQSILIMDTGADQCTCGGNAWIPVHDTGEKVQCNGYYQGATATKGPIVPVMPVVTCVDIPDEE